nr:MAG: ORF2 [Giant panda anellovirus]
MGSVEQRWLESISLSHSCWCHCEDYRRHIPGWPASTGHTGDDDDGALTEDIAVHFDLGFTGDTTTEDVKG